MLSGKPEKVIKNAKEKNLSDMKSERSENVDAERDPRGTNYNQNLDKVHVHCRKKFFNYVQQLHEGFFFVFTAFHSLHHDSSC
jgi:hypothetical protein